MLTKPCSKARRELKGRQSENLTGNPGPSLSHVTQELNEEREELGVNCSFR